VIHGAHEDAGIAAGQVLLSEQQLPTAVLASNDRCALGLMRTLGRGGIDIPQELSVVGYDDSHVSNLLHIDLTTVRQDAGRIAERAVRLAGSDDSTTTAGDPRKSPWNQNWSCAAPPDPHDADADIPVPSDSVEHAAALLTGR
jgi:DNA-binding LacI/PurR family transcriptional regulator